MPTTSPHRPAGPMGWWRWSTPPMPRGRPTRGGLPVSVSVTLDSTALGDRVWTTSRGHTFTAAEQRFTSCDALVTPVVLDTGQCPDTVAEFLAATGPAAGRGQRGRHGAALGRGRIASLATTLLGTRIPLAMGRSARTATPAQRRALAARDRGCIIPGAGSRPRPARRTTSRTGPLAAPPTCRTSPFCVGPITARSTSACGPSYAATEDDGVRQPEPGAPPGTPWPANNGAPWTITRTPRTCWRL